MLPIFNGLLLGLGTAFIIGPVFFTLLKNAHNFGVKGGVFTAIGIIVSDLIVVGICYYFTADLLQQYIHQPWLKWAAAVVLAVLGVRFITQPIVAKESDAGAQIRNPMTRSFIQGFLVNFINPAVFVIWITFIGFAKAKNPSDSIEFWLFIAGILIGIFSTDLLKSFGADYLSGKIRGNFFEYTFKLLGLVLLILAGRLIYMAVIT